MSQRFFAPNVANTGGKILLAAQDRHHNHSIHTIKPRVDNSPPEMFSRKPKAFRVPDHPDPNRPSPSFSPKSYANVLMFYPEPRRPTSRVSSTTPTPHTLHPHARSLSRSPARHDPNYHYQPPYLSDGAIERIATQNAKLTSGDSSSLPSSSRIRSSVGAFPPSASALPLPTPALGPDEETLTAFLDQTPALAEAYRSMVAAFTQLEEPVALALAHRALSEQPDRVTARTRRTIMPSRHYWRASTQADHIPTAQPPPEVAGSYTGTPSATSASPHPAAPAASPAPAPAPAPRIGPPGPVADAPAVVAPPS
ncbi:hypothetical protein PAPYR_2926 [Paratrimastix pyriformis]|uniref:Uncharacterized protein n=1 Tax=Paratrimastix pyriformis TaxID=342808 RepID=A0ABQ8UQX6_9EUKA|nr:hypothetical protein PAPYR_2926 [Paratrimastix pyriformis]